MSISFLGTSCGNDIVPYLCTLIPLLPGDRLGPEGTLSLLDGLVLAPFIVAALCIYTPGSLPIPKLLILSSI